MTTFLYDSYKVTCLDGTSPNLGSETAITISLVTGATYTELATHDFESDLVKYVGTTDQVLTGTSISAAGVFDAADAVFGSVALDTARDVDGFVIWNDTATPTTSQLILFCDNFTAVTPNGGDITVAFDNGANKIFAL